jgi:hypothetical protein
MDTITFNVGDLVMWKGIQMTVVSITTENVFANSCDEGCATRVMDYPSAFTLCNPPIVGEVITPTDPQVQA